MVSRWGWFLELYWAQSENIFLTCLKEDENGETTEGHGLQMEEKPDKDSISS